MEQARGKQPKAPDVKRLVSEVLEVLHPEGEGGTSGKTPAPATRSPRRVALVKELREVVRKRWWKRAEDLLTQRKRSTEPL